MDKQVDIKCKHQDFECYNMYYYIPCSEFIIENIVIDKLLWGKYSAENIISPIIEKNVKYMNGLKYICNIIAYYCCGMFENNINSLFNQFETKFNDAMLLLQYSYIRNDLNDLKKVLSNRYRNWVCMSMIRSIDDD